MLLEVAQSHPPFLIFHGLSDEKNNFTCSIKNEDGTVQAHFLQISGCDVTQMRFFLTLKKTGTGKSLPDLKSRVALKSVQLFRASTDTDRHRETKTDTDTDRHTHTQTGSPPVRC